MMMILMMMSWPPRQQVFFSFFLELCEGIWRWHDDRAPPVNAEIGSWWRLSPPLNRLPDVGIVLLGSSPPNTLVPPSQRRFYLALQNQRRVVRSSGTVVMNVPVIVKHAEVLQYCVCGFLIQTPIEVFFGSLGLYGRGLKHHGIGYNIL
jgi:hypothetical protein